MQKNFYFKISNYNKGNLTPCWTEILHGKKEGYNDTRGWSVLSNPWLNNAKSGVFSFVPYIHDIIKELIGEEIENARIKTRSIR